MTRTKNKTSRARVDPPVNRIEFSRLQPAVEYVPEADASGASGPVHEKKMKSGLVNSYLSPPEKKSAGASSKKSFKLKSPGPDESVSKKRAHKLGPSAPAVLPSFLSIFEASEDSAV